ncbi:MAG: hypothetical protein WD749_12380 [Phycisphaerales bacterium]
MSQTFKPGQSIRVTITAAPRTEAGIDTLERLMRADPDVKRGLRRAQRRRRQDMVVYNRGNRDWYRREKCARIVRAVNGATWTMPFSHQIAPELASVAGNVKVEPA